MARVAKACILMLMVAATHAARGGVQDDTSSVTSEELLLGEMNVFFLTKIYQDYHYKLIFKWCHFTK